MSEHQVGKEHVEFRKGGDIADRLVSLGVAVVRVGRSLPRDSATRHIALQLIQSTTSAGANYEEARAAESRVDFAHKVGLAAKEAREAIYWLKLVSGLNLSKTDLAPLIREAAELSAILIASRRTARAAAEGT